MCWLLRVELVFRFSPRGLASAGVWVLVVQQIHQLPGREMLVGIHEQSSETTLSACLGDAMSQAMRIQTALMQRSEDTFSRREMSTRGHSRLSTLTGVTEVLLCGPACDRRGSGTHSSTGICPGLGSSRSVCPLQQGMPGLPALGPGPGTDSTICKIFAYFGNKCLKFAYEMTVIKNK